MDEAVVDPARVMVAPFTVFDRDDLISVVGIAAANWLIMGTSLDAFVGIAIYVVPEEEAELLRKFGPAYEAYRTSTGRFFRAGLALCNSM